MSAPFDQFINIISAAPTAIAVVDKEIRYIAASQRWIRDYNLEGQEIIGRALYDVFPDFSPEWKTVLSNALAGTTQSSIEYEFTRSNGETQWLSWSVSPWVDNIGAVQGLIMCADDITERKTADIERHRVLTLYNETNEAARIGSWEHDLVSGSIFWSPMVRTICEFGEEFIPDIEGIKSFLKSEEDKEEMDARIYEAATENKPFDIDQEITTGKGNSLWVRVRANPHFNNGKCVRISGTIQDIQELKLQSIQLKDSEEKFKSILENSLNAHFLIRPDGYILEANKAALDMFGYTLEEMRALGRSKLMDVADPNLAAYIKKREETGSASAELTGIRKNGERFPHEISSVSFTDSNGVQRTTVSMIDITERKKAEENLRLSEAEFRAAFEYSALGMSLMDIYGQWIRLNESFCRILGYTNKELMSRTLQEISHPDDRELDAPLVKEVLSGKRRSYHLEKRYLHKNGSVIWVHQASSVVHDLEHQPSHWTVQIQDITEQKNVETALLEERELLRTVIDNIPTSVFIKDLQSRKVLVNKAECEYMGVKDASELLGKDDYELFPIDFARITIAEDQEVFKTERSIVNREKVVSWIDGTTRCLLTSKIPLYDKGKVSGLLGITYDITKIRQAESALFESEQKYRRIFENIQDVFYQTDQEGIITEISPSIEKHSGYSREEVLGKQVTDFYYNIEDRERLVETLKQNRVVNDFEVRLKTKAGEKRYSSVNAQLIIRNGIVICTEGSMRDVTERKLHQDSLQQLNSDLNTLNDQKNKLLSVIAHDLRNPIAGCVGLLEVVFSDIENTNKDELLEYMEMMQKGVLNAHELLEDLLEWARIQFHSVDFIPTRIEDVSADINHTLRKLIPLAEGKQIELRNEIEADMPVMADKHMLASIIRNLVTNAIKFTNKGGTVAVGAVRSGNGYLFSVVDNGIGIPAKDIGKLFSDQTGFTSFGTLGEKGTGMGLGLCRNFVEKHGGKIWVESAEGMGSTFYFTIPDQEMLL